MKVRVVYSATFVAEIDVDDKDSAYEEAEDIDIPENNSSKYMEDTFEIDSITSVETGELI